MHLLDEFVHQWQLGNCDPFSSSIKSEIQVLKQPSLKEWDIPTLNAARITGKRGWENMMLGLDGLLLFLLLG